MERELRDKGANFRVRGKVVTARPIQSRSKESALFERKDLHQKGQSGELYFGDRG